MFVECSYEDAVNLWGEAAVSAVWMRWNKDEERDDAEADDGMRRERDAVAAEDFAREA